MAQKFFIKAIEVRPYYKDAHVNFARLYKNTQRIDEAIKEYEKAIEISPNDDQLYYEIGKIYEDQNDREKAKAFYQKAVRYWGTGGETLTQLKNKLKDWEKK